MSPLSNALSTHIVTFLHKIAGVEVDHDKATSLANSLQDIVRHIPVVVRHCAGSAVREDDRGGAREMSRTWRMVAADTWARSTIMPSLFISSTTCDPN